MSHAIALSVSALNVLLNLFVLFLVAIGAEIAQYGIYKSTQLQLKRRGQAPFITEPDDLFSHFKNRVTSARKSRSVVNLLFVLVSASLIFGEICSEVGVDASQRCEPKMYKTMGLCADPFERAVSGSKVVANAYHTKIVGWDNTELQKYPVYQGFRKSFNGREAFNHPPSNQSQRIIVGGCSSSNPVRIEPHQVSLTISHSSNVWKTFVSQAITPNGSKPLTGYGDLTTNGNTVSAFLVIPTPDKSSHAKARILEYHPKTHLLQVMTAIYKNKSTADHVIRNEEYMISYNILCERFSQSTEDFVHALQVYRSVQLEDSDYTVQNISVWGREVETIPLMNASDAVRAAIAQALMNENNCAGETFEYTECGVYHWQYIAPLLLLFGFVVTFAVSNGLMVMFEKADVEIPHSSSAWSAVAVQHMMQNEEEDEERGEIEEQIDFPPRQGMSHRGYYQLIDGTDGRQEIVFRFNGPRRPANISQEEIWPDKCDKENNLESEL